jgi:hypothetical protein
LVERTPVSIGSPTSARGRRDADLDVSGARRGSRRLLLLPVRTSAQPAIGCYLADPGGPAGQPAGLMVLTLNDSRVRGVTRFLDDTLPSWFGARCG